MTKKNATTEPTEEAKPAEELPGSAEISEKIAGIDAQLAGVDSTITELVAKKDVIVVRAYSDGDMAARTELDELNAKIYLEEQRKRDIGVARSLLEEELQAAEARERAANVRELQEQFRAFHDVIETTKADVLDAGQELAKRARSLRGLLYEEAQLGRKLTLARGITPDVGESWERYNNVLNGVADALAGWLNGAGVPVGRNEMDFRRGIAVGRKNVLLDARKG